MYLLFKLDEKIHRHQKPAWSILQKQSQKPSTYCCPWFGTTTKLPGKLQFRALSSTHQITRTRWSSIEGTSTVRQNFKLTLHRSPFPSFSGRPLASRPRRGPTFLSGGHHQSASSFSGILLRFFQFSAKYFYCTSKLCVSKLGSTVLPSSCPELLFFV